MNFEDISFFFFLGLLMDICILVGGFRFYFKKTTDNQKHAFDLPILPYIIGILSGIFFKRKVLFSVYVFILCVVVHYLIIFLVNLLVKKKRGATKGVRNEWRFLKRHKRFSIRLGLLLAWGSVFGLFVSFAAHFVLV